MRRPAFGAVFVAASLLMAAGCGPIEYIANVPGDASGAIAEAKHVGADKHAPYEITAAEEYIHKARELAGYARFQSAVTFGRKAADNAHKARNLAVEKAALPATDDATPGNVSETLPPVTVAPEAPSKGAGAPHKASEAPAR